MNKMNNNTLLKYMLCTGDSLEIRRHKLAKRERMRKVILCDKQNKRTEVAILISDNRVLSQ